MKDLYRKFALSPSASPETIRARLECSPANVDTSAAKEILLNGDRKRVHDRAYATAAKIGFLESNLKLPVDEPTREFRAGQPGPRTELPSFVQRNERATSLNVSASDDRMWKGQIFAHPAIGGFLAIIFVLIGIAAIVFLCSSLPRNSATSSYVSSPHLTPTQAKVTQTPFNQPWVAFPGNGSYKTRTNKALGAPFKIVTQLGDPNNYYCKLINAYTGITEMELYVAGGFSAEFEVPLGTYRLKYAAGTLWYGEKYLFGDSTVCTEAKALFEFNVEGNQYVGNTVELYRRPGGNLQTEVIPRSDF